VALQPAGNRLNKSTNDTSGSPVDMDLDSPCSPGSASDLSDLFEPPKGSPPASSLPTVPKHRGSGRHKGGKASDSSQWAKIVGKDMKNTPKKSNKNGPGKTSGTPKKSQVHMKIMNDRLVVIDDVPSSAVEMAVKEKFLKKVQRQERVVEEVKLVLKPAYNARKINKEQYKEILRKAVPKICHSRHGEINPSKIENLVKSYIKKCGHSKKKGGDRFNNTL